MAWSDFHLCFLEGSKNVSGSRRMLCIGHHAAEMLTITVSETTCILEKVRLSGGLLFPEMFSLFYTPSHVIMHFLV